MNIFDFVNGNSMVGIFWLLEDRSDVFSMTAQSLEDGEKYGVTGSEVIIRNYCAIGME
jgi:hypothetical protein